MSRLPFHGRRVRVRVPATSANLGPGFDCLALALDLWNETTIRAAGEGLRLECEGESIGIALDERNLVVQGMRVFCETRGLPFPRGLEITCVNHIPPGSGLGSSAAAALTGLLGMAALLDQPLDEREALALAAVMEGHADNAAAALLGGLVMVGASEDGWLARRIETPPLAAAVTLPEVHLPTHAARAALPHSVPLADAAFNLGRTALVVEALRGGDLALLGHAMQDRLHMPYRLPLIPGGQSAMQAAYRAGASAVSLSGAGPSLIAFTSREPGASEKAGRAMAAAFEAEGIRARAFALLSSPVGARVETLLIEQP